MLNKANKQIPIFDPMTKSFEKSVSEAIKKNQAAGHPIARYDAAKKQAYLEYPDGTRSYGG